MNQSCLSEHLQNSIIIIIIVIIIIIINGICIQHKFGTQQMY